MGMVFGKIAVETPNFEVLSTSPDYEIRKYPPAVIAQITYDPSEFNGDRDGGFIFLANYIGALGNPQNAKPETIAMTAPVITKSLPEKISMTAPVVTKEQNNQMVTMQFLLPSKFRVPEDAPAPTDQKVVLTAEGEREYGALRFRGRATEMVAKDKAEDLKKKLGENGYKVIGDFLLARYNPPWTLPIFRTNEILIPIE